MHGGMLNISSSQGCNTFWHSFIHAGILCMFLCVLVPDILCSSFASWNPDAHRHSWAQCARVCDIWHGPIFGDFAWVDGFSTPIYAESCRQTSTDLHDCWMLAFEPSVKVYCVRKGRTAHDHETLNCRTPPVLNATPNRKSSVGSGLEVPRFCNRGAAACSCHWLAGWPLTACSWIVSLR